MSNTRRKSNYGKPTGVSARRSTNPRGSLGQAYRDQGKEWEKDQMAHGQKMIKFWKGVGNRFIKDWFGSSKNTILTSNSRPK